MSKLFEQFKKETGDNWSYKNGWDFAPEEIVTQKYIEWLEQKLTSDKSDYAVTPTASPKLPSLKEVSDYIGYMPDETMTIESTYNVIKKLGNFA